MPLIDQRPHAAIDLVTVVGAVIVVTRTFTRYGPDDPVGAKPRDPQG